MEERAPQKPKAELSTQPHSDGERAILSAVVFIAAIAPLPLGSNSPMPVALLEIAVSLTLVSWALLVNFGKIHIHIATNAIIWPVALYLIVCSWILIQWSPLVPLSLADPIWQSTSDLLGIPLHKRISVNPEATISGLTKLLLYGSFFWLTFQSTRSAYQAWTLIRAIAYTSCAYAIYGIVIYMMGNQWVVIYPKTAYFDSLTSTFVNRNSYATFAGLGLLCAIALLLNHMMPYFALKHPARAKFVIICEELAANAALKTLAVLAIAISLLLSTSRAGIFSSVVGIVSLFLIFFGQQRLKTRHLIYTLVATTVVVSVLFIVGGNYFSKRMDSNDIDSSYAFRNYMYMTTWEAIKSSPLKGTGFGTYADVIPAFKDDRVGAPFQRWDKAHNTYLENALELGLPAAIIFNFSIVLVALITARGIWRRRRNKLIPALGVCATVIVGLHSLVDFSLQIPAVAILYACIMGVAASQSWGANSSISTRRGPV